MSKRSRSPDHARGVSCRKPPRNRLFGAPERVASSQSNAVHQGNQDYTDANWIPETPPRRLPASSGGLRTPPAMKRRERAESSDDEFVPGTPPAAQRRRRSSADDEFLLDSPPNTPAGPYTKGNLRAPPPLKSFKPTFADKLREVTRVFNLETAKAADEMRSEIQVAVLQSARKGKKSCVIHRPDFCDVTQEIILGENLDFALEGADQGVCYRVTWNRIVD